MPALNPVIVAGTARETPSGVQLHVIIDGDDTKGWIHTHGLAALGFPELEIRDFPLWGRNIAASLLNHVAGYMVETGNPVKAGQTMGLADDLVIYFEQKDPIPGDEGHYDNCTRLSIIDPPSPEHLPRCECCDPRCPDHDR